MGQSEDLPSIITLPINGGKVWLVIGLLRVSIPPRSRSAPSLKFKATGHSTKFWTFPLVYIMGGRGEQPLNTHTFSPLYPLSPFLSTLFRSFLPVRFSFHKSVSSPAVAQQCPTSFQLSKSWGSWSPWVARHMLKLLGGGWWWLATEASQNNHPTMYIMKPREWTWLLYLHVCACAAVLKCGMLPVQPVDGQWCSMPLKRLNVPYESYSHIKILIHITAY